jgi:ribosomal protein L37AE/L43A
MADTPEAEKEKPKCALCKKVLDEEEIKRGEGRCRTCGKWWAG